MISCSTLNKLLQVWTFFFFFKWKIIRTMLQNQSIEGRMGSGKPSYTFKSLRHGGKKKKEERSKMFLLLGCHYMWNIRVHACLCMYIALLDCIRTRPLIWKSLAGNPFFGSLLLEPVHNSFARQVCHMHDAINHRILHSLAITHRHIF